MADMEKVIKRLEYCMEHQHCSDCESCAYGGASSVICNSLIKDAIELLKEQYNDLEKAVECLSGLQAQITFLQGVCGYHGTVVRELVRCKDCKYYKPENQAASCCKVLRDENANENWFCADGERKEKG